MNARPRNQRTASLRLALVAILLFAMQPLLHAHPRGVLPQEHRAGLHAPGPDFPNAAVGEGQLVPDPMVVAEANRLDDLAPPPALVDVPAPGEGGLPKALLPSTEQDLSTVYDINAVSDGGEPSPRSILKTPFTESSPEVSPDGRWIAYVSDETGRPEVNIPPVSGSLEQWQISTGGGTRARWRGDSRELYFASPDGFLMAASIETQPFIRPGTPRRLFQLPERPDRLLPIFEDVTPDGKRFLLNVPVVARSSVGFHVIANWPSLLAAHRE